MSGGDAEHTIRRRGTGPDYGILPRNPSGSFSGMSNCSLLDVTRPVPAHAANCGYAPLGPADPGVIAQVLVEEGFGRASVRKQAATFGVHSCFGLPNDLSNLSKKFIKSAKSFFKSGLVEHSNGYIILYRHTDRIKYCDFFLVLAAWLFSQ